MSYLLLYVSIMTMQHLIDHETDQAVHGHIAHNEFLSKRSPGMGLEQKSRYEPSGCHWAWRWIQATLTNTSCPTSHRATDLLYGFWVRRREREAACVKKKKAPGHENQREKTGRSQTGEAKFVSGLGGGEATSPHRWAFSVSPISQVNQWLR